MKPSNYDWKPVLEAMPPRPHDMVPSKSQVIAFIRSGVGCDEKMAVAIFDQARHGKFPKVKFSKETKLWTGTGFKEVP